MLFYQIGQMLFYLLALNYNIINVCFHVPHNLCFKHLSHHSLINGSFVFDNDSSHLEHERPFSPS